MKEKHVYVGKHTVLGILFESDFIVALKLIMEETSMFHPHATIINLIKLLVA